MTTIEFDSSNKLIVIEAAVWGPGGKAPLTLVLDTGSWQTLIVPDVMDDLGFNPRDGQVITSVYSAVGKEQGYMISVPQFSALGFTVTDFPIHVFDLADQYGIDGLLGAELPTPLQLPCALRGGPDLRRRDRGLSATPMDAVRSMIAALTRPGRATAPPAD